MKAKSVLVSRRMFHTTVLSQTPGDGEGTVAQLFRWLFFSMLRDRFSNSAFADLETWHKGPAAKANCSFRVSPVAGGRLSLLSCWHACPTLSGPRGCHKSPDWPAGIKERAGKELPEHLWGSARPWAGLPGRGLRDLLCHCHPQPCL